VKKVLLGAFTIVLYCVGSDSTDAETTFAAARAQATRCYKATGGSDYSKKLLPKITAMAKKVMGYESCFSLNKSSSCDVVLIIGSNGSVQQAIPHPRDPIAACVAPQLKRYKFPPPKNGVWYQLVTFERKIERKIKRDQR
jgi:hypothetical protein